MSARWAAAAKWAVRLLGILFYASSLWPTFTDSPVETSDGPKLMPPEYYTVPMRRAAVCAVATGTVLYALSFAGTPARGAERQRWAALCEIAVAAALAVSAVRLPLHYMVQHRDYCAAWRRGHAWRLTEHTLFVLSLVGADWLATSPPGWTYTTQDELEERLAPLVCEYQREHPKRGYLTHYIIKFGSEGHLLDGWARRLRVKRQGPHITLYSVGPNGIDELGAGDDMFGLTLSHVGPEPATSAAH